MPYVQTLSENAMKKLMRKRMKRILRELKRTFGTFLDLAALEFELTLHALSLGYQVHVVEKCEEIHLLQKEMLYPLKYKFINTITCFNQSVHKFLENAFKYDLMYLDTCCTISKELHKLIVSTNGKANHMFLTVYMARWSSYTEEIKKYTAIGLVNKWLVEEGWIVEEVVSYTNEKNPMCVFQCRAAKPLKTKNKLFLKKRKCLA